ncbi:carbamoyl-phosphate synthase large subunit [Gehongia tenuis]|uniref:Carbamoyl phosphate synthase large chain n=1 Tax=Gehongia tenuis TaxID=2763655 RepID=A0A926D6S3_9FIRM|nr:carbamoyl-phosphate synthase large subunit [Gehongia tenuis]MBC8531405.1 carbamoyl-phosphate synthase large subunit [Gehongia tenuis]
MPKIQDIHKVLVIGSGPIIIGQAAEFDYSGTQACKALREEGIRVVLINSNPATIMTDRETADKVYIEPIDVDTVKRIIETEKPDGLLASLGGQTGLNMAVELAKDDYLNKMGVRLLGTSLESIEKAEDRELFKNTMLEIGEPVPESTIVTSLEEAEAFAEKVGFPIIVRPAYTLGGTGGGAVHSMEELHYTCGKGLKMSMIGQVLLEQSMAGFKEIEFEVMRDGADNCIIVCSMENFDPVGVHTGDSIVVAPCQTLTAEEYQMLRSASFKIIRALGIEGGCNIQYALDTRSQQYYIIEVNPRVSRSSALASKATGYPIARMAAKIALGLRLDEIQNSVTPHIRAFFEPTIDYVVTKVPRWPFDKFTKADRSLGTQMKATGEVMAMGRTFEESLLKAVDSLDIKFNYQLGMDLFENVPVEELRAFLEEPNDQRLFAICKAFQKGMSLEEIQNLTRIDPFFLRKLQRITGMVDRVQAAGEALDEKLYLAAKAAGFGDGYIANLAGLSLEKVEEIGGHRTPSYKSVDTCAGEYEATTPYYYSAYDDHEKINEEPVYNRVMVVGSGPIRIGQGIEFDYCSVHSVKALRKLGYETVIVNNNPETISTDFDISDKLYFEPLTTECVLDVYHRESPEGAIVQFGGQTAINLASKLEKAGVKILGTPVDSIDLAEDRERFLELLKNLGIPLPPGGTAFTVEGALAVAKKIGYPVLVRPSYVLGGRGMEVVYSDEELISYVTQAVEFSSESPILIDRYILGREVEVDGICDGDTVVIPGIMEHVERSGIHSGDSIAIYPSVHLSAEAVDTIVDYSVRMAKAIGVVGLFNVQFVLDTEENVYVIEVNPRASRTVPILSKVTGVPMVQVATQAIMGKKLADLGYSTGLVPAGEFYAVKAPVFSFAKLSDVDTDLGPEMKSTGEVLGVAKDLSSALYKALKASGLKIPESGKVLFSISDREKAHSESLASRLVKLGFELVATPGTHAYLAKDGIEAELIAEEDVLDAVQKDTFRLIINTKTLGVPGSAGFALRRTAIEYNVPCITAMDTARALIKVMEDPGAESKKLYSLDAYEK